MARGKAFGKSAGKVGIEQTKIHGESVDHREFGQRKWNKIDRRRNSPVDKHKGQQSWLRARRRVRRKLLDR